jgi:hypothetical protein
MMQLQRMVQLGPAFTGSLVVLTMEVKIEKEKNMRHVSTHTRINDDLFSSASQAMEYVFKRSYDLLEYFLFVPRGTTS